MSDDPRDGSESRPDELERESFATYMLELLENVRAQSESSVLALIGDWGSGKSSVLETLRLKLTSDTSTSWLIAELNPWMYASPRHLQDGFFEELISSLPRESRPNGTRKKIGNFAQTISPLGKLGGLVGVDLEDIISGLGNHVVGDQSAMASKRAAEQALRDSGNPILMIIDDLDRLTPDELLETLKLVRLIGRLPNVYYLLCYDERTLLDVLRETSLAKANELRARAYMEKIVQVRIDMPALRENQKLNLINKGLDSILLHCAEALDAEQRDRLGRIYDSALQGRLTTPRSIGRLLGQLQAFYPPIQGEVDFVDFFLVTWVRTQEPGIYRLLLEKRTPLLTGDIGLWAIDRTPKDAKKRFEYWRDEINRAGVASEHLDGVMKVLSALFPQIEAAFSSESSYTTAMSVDRARRIANRDYFDRYLNFGVPADDLPDSVVLAALRDLEAGVWTPTLDHMSRELCTHTARAVRKVESLRDEGVILPDVQLLKLIVKLWPDVDSSRKEIFGNPRRTLLRQAERCMVAMGATVAPEVVAPMLGRESERDPLIAAIHLLARDQRNQSTEIVPPEFNIAPLVRLASDALENKFEGSLGESPLEDDALGGFWRWRDLSPEKAGPWLRSQIDSGRWNLTDVIGALVSKAYSSSDSIGYIGELDTESLNAAIPLDELLDSLPSSFDENGSFSGEPLHTLASDENRVKYGISVLLDMRERREQTSAFQEEA